jgi:phenylacetate-CoA ligase
MGPLHQKYLETIRRTQWLAPDRLLSYQARLITDITRHAHETVPFYRERLAPLFRGGTLDLRRWRDVPILTRADVHANGEAMQALSVPRSVARDTEGSTSGTTGHSLKFTQSELAGIASRCLRERTLEAHGIDKAAHMARIGREVAGVGSYPDGLEDTGWALTNPDAPWSRLSIHTSIAEQADWLTRRAAAYLWAYPSTAVALARHTETTGQHVSLRGVLTSGETVDSTCREDVQRVFGCSIVDNYGTTEIGYIAFQCPAGGGYHVCAESVLLELVDAEGNDVEPGEQGHVVLTPLYNFAMPFVRYAIGDLAIAAEGPCPCGRALPRLAAILGRQRNIFTFPDGTQRSPWQWRSRFTPHMQVKQFQVVQTALDEIELRYLPQDGAAEPDAALIAEIGRRYIHPQVLVRPVRVAAIERHASGKIEDCVSLVQPPAGRREP